mmetsp:Transcript_17949/g.29048  ORF Transcript_17949/g.29048 Transcript_17949/m.29048 type:complete len:89 (+) Transcript_17949:49-315(+)
MIEQRRRDQMARKLEQFWPIKTVQHLPKRGVYCIAVASVLGLGCLVVISNRKWKQRKLLFSQQAASIDGDVAQNKKLVLQRVCMMYTI